MLGTFLRSLLQHGSVTVLTADGRKLTFGSGEPHLTLRLLDRLAWYELAMHPDLKLGELYMNGRLTMEHGTIVDLLDLLVSNLGGEGLHGIPRLMHELRKLKRRISQYNPASRARSHVAHHYDLSADLYDLFLDRDRQYSCAYFTGEDEPLEDAQIGKKRHIAAKLYLEKQDLSVLDIGCGWGGLALDLARDCGAKVTGVTLSTEQLKVARNRAVRQGLSERCAFELIDYRHIVGAYDRIVSVGMFEHVGVGYYDAFFSKVRDLLKDDGVMLLHTIGRLDGPGATNAWIAKYIFPGGYVPSMSEILPAIERSGLIVADIEILRLHYAMTLKRWRERFQAHRAEIARLYDERFCRMWEFYLAGCEMTFRYDRQAVFQIQLARRIDALPITRDYMVENERTMRFAGVTQMPRPSRAA